MHLDTSHLFKCRVAVARMGEMDNVGAGWWNTTGLLSPIGAAALRRNFPYTHWFAQSRAAIAVANKRSLAVFPLPQQCISLWAFPPEIETALDEGWHHWLNDETSWHPFFDGVAKLSAGTVSHALQELQLATASEVAAIEPLKRSHEAKALLVPSREPLDNVAITNLALGFSHGEQGKLTVPYMRLSGELG